MARMQHPEVKSRLIANTEISVARGAFGSPTFFVGDAMYFGKDRLRDVEEAQIGMVNLAKEMAANGQIEINQGVAEEMVV